MAVLVPISPPVNRTTTTTGASTVGVTPGLGGTSGVLNITPIDTQKAIVNGSTASYGMTATSGVASPQLPGGSAFTTGAIMADLDAYWWVILAAVIAVVVILWMVL